MVVEIAEFTVLAGHEEAFARDIARGVTEELSQARGYLASEVVRGMESPQRFVLVVQWATLEDHTEGFRGSAAFSRWRGLIGPHFDQAPRVEHYLPSSGGRD
jgi:heme-degrading monooxygenase HmoA